MMLALLLLATVAAQDLSSQAPPVTPDGSALEISVASRRDGRDGGRAGDSGTSRFETYVFARACVMGASVSRPQTPQGTGWHAAGEVLSQRDDAVRVRIEWRRLSENDQWLPERADRVEELTLKLGDRVVLDTPPPGTYECGDVNLEARIVPRQPEHERARDGARASGGARTASGVTRSGGARAGAIARTPVAASPVVDLELWLVDKQAEGFESARRQLVRAGGDYSGAFTFTSPVYGLVDGPATIMLSGTIRTQGPRLLMQLDRSIRFSEGRKAPVIEGNFIVFAMPERDEVIAIVPPRTAGSTPPLPGHEFSLRVRVAPPQ